MKIIGITGGSGAGKSTLCAELERCGATVVDADAISRMVTKNGGAAFDEIVQSFGDEILDGYGEINRKALAKIVFNDSHKLELLEKITHKYVFEEMQRQISECKSQVAVLDVPLLFNENFPFYCDVTVAVIADKAVRLKRIMQRDGLDETAALERLKNQITDEEYRVKADICFVNDGNIDKIKEFANNLCKI